VPRHIVCIIWVAIVFSFARAGLCLRRTLEVQRSFEITKLQAWVAFGVIVRTYLAAMSPGTIIRLWPDVFTLSREKDYRPLGSLQGKDML